VTASGVLDRDRDPAGMLAVRGGASRTEGADTTDVGMDDKGPTVISTTLPSDPQPGVDGDKKPFPPMEPIEGETKQQRWKRESIQKMRHLMTW
jgi:hypothetical protein